MKRPPRIQGRYESMTERASRARLPFLDDGDPAAQPASGASAPMRRLEGRGASLGRQEPRGSKRQSQEPNEMTRVVFGSLAPGVQPALDWLGTHNGKKALATGTVALGALAVTRLLST